MSRIILFISCSLFLSCIMSWAQDLEDGGANKSIIEDKTSIENPLKLRDPFMAPNLGQSSIDVPNIPNQASIRDGVYTNLPSAQDLSLNNIKIVGVLLGSNRRVIVTSKDSRGETFMLKEGMKINGDKVELKSIVPGGAVFVERITNVYGQLEFLETMVPISK